jgi:rhamnose transport system substrate-binding protein
MKLMGRLGAGLTLAAILLGTAAVAQDNVRIALVVKSLGNGFFEAAHRGAEEAAGELGNVEIIYTGPTDTTAEGQIEVVNSLIAQQVDAIAISANDPDALVPALKRAMDRGITVISWDSGVAAEGRQMHLNPSDTDLIGETIIKLAADYLPEGGDVAILSASSTATNQNAWIEAAKKILPSKFPKINLVATVYGDDDAVKSTNEAKGLIASAATAVALAATPVAAQDTTRIALVVKALGIGFFEAAAKGAEEAAAELGNVEIIYTGPTDTTAEGQIEVINALIAQDVDAIAVSANDKDALVPALKKAMDRGITVISWDSGVAPEGRQMNLNPSSSPLIGNMIIKLAADNLPDGGDVAVLSASATATNQNTWIEEMNKVMGNYPGINVVATVYGDDLADKSYRETQGLISSYPDLKAIIAPTSVGIVAAAQAVADAGKIGEINVTGLGLPSEMAGAVESGASKSFAIWNPIDLGYAATMIAYNLATGAATAEAGGEIPMGRMGSVALDDNLEGAMADPFVYDASNIEEFKDIF